MADRCDNTNDLVDEWFVEYGKEMWNTRVRQRAQRKNRPDPGPIGHVRVKSSFGSGTVPLHIYGELMTQEEKAVGVHILIKPNEGAKSSVMRNCNLLQFVQESLAVLADDDAVIGDYEPKEAKLRIEAEQELITVTRYRGKRTRFLQQAGLSHSEAPLKGFSEAARQWLCISKDDMTLAIIAGPKSS